MFKKMLICMTALAMIAGVAMKAEAATSADITVTVTLQEISVSVVPGTWGIGVVAASSVNTQACTATNDGNGNEDLDISVTNSGDWTAAATAGLNQFVMAFSLTGGPTWTPITTGEVDLKNDLAPGDQTFTLQFTAPSSSAIYTEQSITVTVSASAS